MDLCYYPGQPLEKRGAAENWIHRNEGNIATKKLRAICRLPLECNKIRKSKEKITLHDTQCLNWGTATLGGLFFLQDVRSANQMSKSVFNAAISTLHGLLRSLLTPNTAETADFSCLYFPSQ